MIIKLRHYNLGLPTIKYLVGSFLLQIYTNKLCKLKITQGDENDSLAKYGTLKTVY